MSTPADSLNDNQHQPVANNEGVNDSLIYKYVLPRTEGRRLIFHFRHPETPAQNHENSSINDCSHTKDAAVSQNHADPEDYECTSNSHDIPAGNLPWDLRPRWRGRGCYKRGRTTAETDIAETQKRMHVVARQGDASASRSINAAGRNNAEKPLRFCLTLSEDEVKADLIAISGSKPPRKPKKKLPKSLQRKLNSLFPGSKLETPTAKMYQ